MKENAAGRSVPVARYLLLGLDFFSYGQNREKRLEFSTGEGHLLGQDAVECMSVLLHWDPFACHCQQELSPASAGTVLSHS